MTPSKKAPTKGRKPAAGTALGTSTGAKTAGEEKVKSKARAKTEVKPGKEKHPRADADELCVFAVRLSSDLRSRLHAVAGSAGASRLARAVLAATADGDVEAFKRAVAAGREAAAKSKK